MPSTAPWAARHDASGGYSFFAGNRMFSVKTLALAIALAVAACAAKPVEFSKPDKNAPVWDLNVGSDDGANDLIHPAGEN